MGDGHRHRSHGDRCSPPPAPARSWQAATAPSTRLHAGAPNRRRLDSPAHRARTTVTMGGERLHPRSSKRGDHVEAKQPPHQVRLGRKSRRKALSAQTVIVVTEGADQFSFRRAAGIVAGRPWKCCAFGSTGSPRDAKGRKPAEVIKNRAADNRQPQRAARRAPPRRLATLAKKFQSRVTLHKGEGPRGPAVFGHRESMWRLDLAKGDRGCGSRRRGNDAFRGSRGV